MSRVTVGLCGVAGAGKDTAADYLVMNHGFTRVAFADAVREAALAIDPMVLVSDIETSLHACRLAAVIEAYGWDTAKRKFPDVRRLLQRLGTEMGRDQFGYSFWADIGHKKASGVDRVVFTDVRFATEADVVRRLGGVVLRIVRPESGLTGEAAEHRSETPDFDWDDAIKNDGTPDELGYKLTSYLGITYGAGGA